MWQPLTIFHCREAATAGTEADITNMISQWRHSIVRFATMRSWGVLHVAVLLILMMFAAAGQEAGRQDATRPAQPVAPASSVPDSPTPPAQAPAPRNETGFFGAINRWIDKSSAEFNAGLNDIRNKINDFSERSSKAAKAASDAMTKFPSARMVEGRERCLPAPNGSPDCRTAAESICKSKGFKTGNSIDTQSAQKCPARIWLSGRLPAEGECAVETFVTRAACQ